MESSKIREKIRDVTTEYWLEYQKPLFLTQIKSVLKRNGMDVERLLAGKKLKQFLEEDTTAGYRIVKPPTDATGQRWALVPENVDPSAAFATWEESKTSNHAGGSSPSIIWFNRRIFAAFVKTLAEGHRRYIRLDAPPSFDDLPDGTPCPPGSKEIDRRYIKQGDAPLDNQIVANQLRAWASEEDVPLSELIAKKQEPLDRGRDRLADALRSLDKTELARISVPLDLVLKLLK